MSHRFTDSQTRVLANSLNHWLTRRTFFLSFIYSVIHIFAYCPTNSFIHPLTSLYSSYNYEAKNSLDEVQHIHVLQYLHFMWFPLLSVISSRLSANILHLQDGILIKLLIVSVSRVGMKTLIATVGVIALITFCVVMVAVSLYLKAHNKSIVQLNLTEQSSLSRSKLIMLQSFHLLFHNNS